jgi:hypothetical protein
VRDVHEVEHDDNPVWPTIFARGGGFGAHPSTNRRLTAPRNRVPESVPAGRTR